MAESELVTRESLQPIADALIDLVLRKNADYGNAWTEYGVAGLYVRLKDKGLRLQNLADGRQALVVDEKIGDTLLDAGGYCLLALLALSQP